MQSYIFSLDFLGFEVENCCFLSHSLYFFGDTHIWQVEISEKIATILFFYFLNDKVCYQFGIISCDPWTTG